MLSVWNSFPRRSGRNIAGRGSLAPGTLCVTTTTCVSTFPFISHSWLFGGCSDNAESPHSAVHLMHPRLHSTCTDGQQDSDDPTFNTEPSFIMRLSKELGMNYKCFMIRRATCAESKCRNHVEYKSCYIEWTAYTTIHYRYYTVVRHFPMWTPDTEIEQVF